MPSFKMHVAWRWAMPDRTIDASGVASVMMWMPGVRFIALVDISPVRERLSAYS